MLVKAEAFSQSTSNQPEQTHHFRASLFLRVFSNQTNGCASGRLDLADGGARGLYFEAQHAPSPFAGLWQSWRACEP